MRGRNRPEDAPTSGAKRLSVDLRADWAELVEVKVASGEYDTEDDVAAEGLRALQDEDPAVPILT